MARNGHQGTALVTGASSGIGATYADRLAGNIDGVASLLAGPFAGAFGAVRLTRTSSRPLCVRLAQLRAQKPAQALYTRAQADRGAAFTGEVWAPAACAPAVLGAAAALGMGWAGPSLCVGQVSTCFTSSSTRRTREGTSVSAALWMRSMSRAMALCTALSLGWAALSIR